jgi:hypothetical protein
MLLSGETLATLGKKERSVLTTALQGLGGLHISLNVTGGFAKA